MKCTTTLLLIGCDERMIVMKSRKQPNKLAKRISHQ
jgi:hypothetical protein